VAEPEPPSAEPSDDTESLEARRDHVATYLPLPSVIPSTRIQHYIRLRCLHELALHKVNIYAETSTDPAKRRDDARRALAVLSRIMNERIPLSDSADHPTIAEVVIALRRRQQSKKF